MATSTLEDVQRVVAELRHLRGHKLLSTDWQHVIEAEDMLLDLAAADLRKSRVLGLPEDEGVYWCWQPTTSCSGWEIVRARRITEPGGGLWRLAWSFLGGVDVFEPMIGRWVKIPRPPLFGE